MADYYGQPPSECVGCATPTTLRCDCGDAVCEACQHVHDREHDEDKQEEEPPYREPEPEIDRKYWQAARDVYEYSDDVAVDDDAEVTISDGGAWITARVWISEFDIKKEDTNG